MDDVSKSYENKINDINKFYEDKIKSLEEDLNLAAQAYTAKVAELDLSEQSYTEYKTSLTTEKELKKEITEILNSTDFFKDRSAIEKQEFLNKWLKNNSFACLDNEDKEYFGYSVSYNKIVWDSCDNYKLRYLTINCNNGTRIKTEEEEIPFSNIFQKIFYWIIGKRI